MSGAAGGTAVGECKKHFGNGNALRRVGRKRLRFGIGRQRGASYVTAGCPLLSLSPALHDKVKFACELPELDTFPALSSPPPSFPSSPAAAATTHFSRHKAERGRREKGPQNSSSEAKKRLNRKRGAKGDDETDEVRLSIRGVPVAFAVRRIVKKRGTSPALSLFVSPFPLPLN